MIEAEAAEKVKRVIHLLRNPYGHSPDELREARHIAADILEGIECYIPLGLLRPSRAHAHLSASYRENPDG